MADPTAQARFEALAAQGAEAGEPRRLAAAIRTGDSEAARDLAALWLHAAAAAPERLAATYDATAEGWLGAPPRAAPMEAAASPAPIPQDFWTAFWALARDPDTGRDAGTITQRTAELGRSLDPAMGDRVARMALAYPGVREAAAQGYPERFTLEALARAPAGSLGAQFHDLIVDNGFDLEVLDREALGLADLPAPLDYLNARILQCHDLWHLTAGYRTTALHEVAISGFQAGQFGHHYSSMFLAMVLTRTAFDQPDVVGLMLDVILSAWTHGRESPPLLGVDWPAVWGRSLEEVRAGIGLTAYASPYPADLFEQLRAAAS
ncbi:MAG TPA: Coq4 family protein [Phenylobacterium sp.]|nr:Coq4 family protein [Phenylobacterium sp.]